MATGDTLTVANQAVLTNAAAGTIDLAGAGSDLYGYGNGTGPGVVDNNGTLDAQLTTGTSSISTPLTNNTTGVIEIGTGVLAVTDGLTNEGRIDVDYQTLDVSGGLTLESKGTVTFDVSATAHGTLTSTSPTKVGGHVAVTLASGYTETVGTAVTLITTTGTQSVVPPSTAPRSSARPTPVEDGHCRQQGDPHRPAAHRRRRRLERTCYGDADHPVRRRRHGDEQRSRSRFRYGDAHAPDRCDDLRIVASGLHAAHHDHGEVCAGSFGRSHGSSSLRSSW